MNQLLFTGGETYKTLDDIREVASGWERISIPECVSRYKNVEEPRRRHRNVVMVASNIGEEYTEGWTPNEVRKNATWEGCEFGSVPPSCGYKPESRDQLNSLWTVFGYETTDTGMLDAFPNGQVKSRTDRMNRLVNFDNHPEEGILYLWGQDSPWRDNITSLQAHYCLSEPFEAECTLETNNSILLWVSCVGVVVSVICPFAIWGLGNDKPILTVGDAIRAFILEPDPATKRYCTMGRRDVKGWWKKARQRTRAGAHAPCELGARRMPTNTRKYGHAISPLLWLLSYFVLGSGIIVAIVFSVIAEYHQNL